MKKVFTMLAALALVMASGLSHATQMPSVAVMVGAMVDATSMVEKAEAAGYSQTEHRAMLKQAYALADKGDTNAANVLAEKVLMLSGLDVYESYFLAGLYGAEHNPDMQRLFDAQHSAIEQVQKAKGLGYASVDADELLSTAYSAVEAKDFSKALDYFERAEFLAGLDIYETYFLEGLESS